MLSFVLSLCRASTLHFVLRQLHLVCHADPELDSLLAKHVCPLAPLWGCGSAAQSGEVGYCGVSGYELLKSVHQASAFLSLGGFALRGYWMLRDHPLLQRRLTKTIPHVIDTLLLGTALGMLYVWQLNPFEVSWLSAKIIALLVYIILGMVALRFGRTKKIRAVAWGAALLTVCYIISVAFTRSPAEL